jgi:hypothetical protein
VQRQGMDVEVGCGHGFSLRSALWVSHRYVHGGR